jgi:hypothetical protein
MKFRNGWHLIWLIAQLDEVASARVASCVASSIRVVISATGMGLAKGEGLGQTRAAFAVMDPANSSGLRSGQNSVSKRYPDGASRHIEFSAHFFRAPRKTASPSRPKFVLLNSKENFADSRPARFRQLSASIGRFLKSSARTASSTWLKKRLSAMRMVHSAMAWRVAPIARRRGLMDGHL